MANPLNSEEWEARLSQTVARLFEIMDDPKLDTIDPEHLQSYAIKLTAAQLIVDLYTKTMYVNYQRDQSDLDKANRRLEVMTVDDYFKRFSGGGNYRSHKLTEEDSTEE